MAVQAIGVFSIISGILFLVFSKNIILGRRNTKTMAKFAFGNPTQKQIQVNRMYGIAAIALGFLCLFMLG